VKRLSVEEQELVTLVRRKGGAVTVRDVQRWRPKVYKEADDAEAALNDLQRLSRGYWKTTETTVAKAPGSKSRSLGKVGGEPVCSGPSGWELKFASKII
jgi:hypothetical protein